MKEEALGLDRLLEQAAVLLKAGDVVSAGKALQEANGLCQRLAKDGVQLPREVLKRALAAQQQLNSMVPLARAALAQALKSAGDSRRAGKAYAGL